MLKQALEDDGNILNVYTNITELVRLRKLATAQSQNLEAETLVRGIMRIAGLIFRTGSGQR